MPSSPDFQIEQYLQKLHQPAKDSHKGQNGKLLIVGGSELFHAAGKWALDAASKIVDMVFYSSVPSNNELVREAKSQFWNGIVIERDAIADYAEEADCILIGPGMDRSQETEQTVNTLFKTYPDKKWVIDAGALQMGDPELFPARSILTPHANELEMIAEHMNLSREKALENLVSRGSTVLLTGGVDRIFIGERALSIEGGHGGMTKGGTGDVLAGIVAGLYCKNEAEVAAVMGSWINKDAGEKLGEKYWFFNAGDVIEMMSGSK